MITASYRPRNPGHDYYGRGTYLITLVVSDRLPLLGRLGDDVKHPQVALSPLGTVVRQEWEAIPGKQHAHGNSVAVHAWVCMPDHFHGVLEVLEPMQWSLGDIIQAFKAACTSQWQQQQGQGRSTNRPISADWWSPQVPAWLREKARLHDNEGSLIRALSKRQRQQYYTLVDREQRPLFDENYDDTVCLDQRHRQAMIAYVNDNPRRAILRRALPRLMQRTLHVQIGGRDYGTFGNLFLLRWPGKVQVQCHRRHPVTREPYENTADYARQHQQWIDAILRGATVMVTPGISHGELMMKNECLNNGYPLIHIQKEPITAYWKPERTRFEACANGSLLILAPWGLDTMAAVNGVPADTDYSRFHNMNNLAAEICTFNGNAKILL
ncbi:MAG: hypothetical protein II905_00705 [Muribaculaceae bacterium]|nr:hypothetical protein [Muribaculaceae bacterium]